MLVAVGGGAGVLVGKGVFVGAVVAVGAGLRVGVAGGRVADGAGATVFVRTG